MQSTEWRRKKKLKLYDGNNNDNHKFKFIDTRQDYITDIFNATTTTTKLYQVGHAIAHYCDEVYGQ